MATGYRRESEATLGHLADVARWDDPEGRDAGAGSDDGPVLASTVTSLRPLVAVIPDT